MKNSRGASLAGDAPGHRARWPSAADRLLPAHQLGKLLVEVAPRLEIAFARMAWAQEAVQALTELVQARFEEDE